MPSTGAGPDPVVEHLDRRNTVTDTPTPRPHAAGASRFAFVHHLDPLRSVEGTRTRFDCPDVAALDRHLATLRRRIAGAGSPDLADAWRADVDALLDRRAWLTLPVVA